MPLTVISLQAVLSARCGTMVVATGQDGSAASSFWTDPLTTAARELRITLANPIAVADSDLTAVVQNRVTELLDVAELRSLESALYSNTDVDEKIALGENKWGDIRKDLETAVKRKAEYVMRRYGIGRGTLTGGLVDLPFQQRLNTMGIADPDDCD